MNKRLLTLCFLTTVFLSLHAQQTFGDFKAETSQYYHKITTDDVENYSFLITSAAYINFIGQYADSSYYYPLKITWVSDERSFYEVQPFPAVSDSVRKQVYAQAQSLKNLWNYIFPDLNKFVFREPLYDVPDNAMLKSGTDTVGVYFTLDNEARPVISHQTFSKGGQLGRVIWTFGERKEVYYPTYKEVAGKWLCLGWDGQIYEKGDVVSGLRTKLVYMNKDKKLLPEQINLFVQNRNAEGKVDTYPRVLFLKDFKFNQPIQVISNKADSTATPKN